VVVVEGRLIKDLTTLARLAVAWCCRGHQLLSVTIRYDRLAVA